jgi:hypothetical protein
MARYVLYADGDVDAILEGPDGADFGELWQRYDGQTGWSRAPFIEWLVDSQGFEHVGYETVDLDSLPAKPPTQWLIRWREHGREDARERVAKVAMYGTPDEVLRQYFNGQQGRFDATIERAS